MPWKLRRALEKNWFCVPAPDCTGLLICNERQMEAWMDQLEELPKSSSQRVVRKLVMLLKWPAPNRLELPAKLLKFPFAEGSALLVLRQDGSILMTQNTSDCDQR